MHFVSHANSDLKALFLFYFAWSKLQLFVESKRSKIEEDPTVPQCPLCHRKFGSSSALNRHLKEGTCLDTSNMDNSCIDNNHVDSSCHDNNKHTCHDCLQNFDDIDSLDNHTCQAAVQIKMEEDDKTFFNVEDFKGKSLESIHRQSPIFFIFY